MGDIVLFALPGVVLIVWGVILRRRRPATSSALPPAKIDDGRPFRPPHGWRRGIGAALIAIGILLALGGGFFGLLQETFGHGRWPPG
jgi:hypothetical protein